MIMLNIIIFLYIIIIYYHILLYIIFVSQVGLLSLLPV